MRALLLVLLLVLAGCAKVHMEEKRGEIMAKKALIIVAPVNFRDEECLEPKKILENEKINVTVASKGTKTAKGSMGASLPVDIDISEVDVSEYDAVIFIGGPGATVYFNNSAAMKIARDAVVQGKVLAAICIAPSILANAGVLEGIEATAFPSEKGNLIAKGANYTGKDLSVDGNIITANGPAAARKFGTAIADALR